MNTVSKVICPFVLNVWCLHRYAFPIKCTEVILADDNETILEIRAEYDPSKKTKPKVYKLRYVCYFKLTSLRVCKIRSVVIY